MNKIALSAAIALLAANQDVVLAKDDGSTIKVTRIQKLSDTGPAAGIAFFSENGTEMATTVDANGVSSTYGALSIEPVAQAASAQSPALAYVNVYRGGDSSRTGYAIGRSTHADVNSARRAAAGHPNFLFIGAVTRVD